LAERVKDRLSLSAGERIKDGLSRTPCFDKTIAAEAGQVLGKRRLTQPNQPLQLVDAAFPADQFAENHQAMLIAHGFEQNARGAGIVL
jgi:hypothetical protein